MLMKTGKKKGEEIKEIIVLNSYSRIGVSGARLIGVFYFLF
jgi:hypothetical protein